MCSLKQAHCLEFFKDAKTINYVEKNIPYSEYISMQENVHVYFINMHFRHTTMCNGTVAMYSLITFHAFGHIVM